MFVGHFAVAFAAKRAQPTLPLPALFTAVQLLDILWPALVLLGIEHTRIVPGITAASPLDLYDIPWSHSLVTSLVWSVLFAWPWWRRRNHRAAAIVAGCVFSHFVLDWITHRPDMPLAPGSDLRFGLGLWNSLGASIAVEALLFLGGIYLYASGTHARSRIGSVGFWSLVVLLTAAWLSGPFGPPPPNIDAVVLSALGAVPIILAWGWLIDRNRRPIVPMR